MFAPPAITASRATPTAAGTTVSAISPAGTSQSDLVARVIEGLVLSRCWAGLPKPSQRVGSAQRIARLAHRGTANLRGRAGRGKNGCVDRPVHGLRRLTRPSRRASARRDVTSRDVASYFQIAP